MTTSRYLIGGGENLALDVGKSSYPPDKAHPYSFDRARKRLAPQLLATAEKLKSLPPLACPGGNGVFALTLHPTYLAKSYYPNNLFRSLRLSHVGSRAVHLVPEAVTSAQPKDRPQPAPSFFVAASVNEMEAFAKRVANWQPDEKAAEQFRQIERIAALDDSRLKPIPEEFCVPGREIPLEVVIHASNFKDDNFIVGGFYHYVRSLGLNVDLDKRRYTGGLCFLPMRAPYESLDDIVAFSFLRALRRMPRLVPLDPLMRSLVPGFRVTFPDPGVVAEDLSVAIFDGGLPSDHGLESWVTLHESDGVGAPVPSLQQHGMAVTSAFLFGPLEYNQQLPRPLAHVDHWRVLGAENAQDDFQLYEVLDLIEQVLTTQQYDFINISLGPDEAMENDDVNRWTSTLDTLLANGDTVATVACGNNGEGDAELKLNRVQPPSDGVNMIGVGAADRSTVEWARAPYSAIGPGRSPGYVKPDLLSFGGSHQAPFLVLDGTRIGYGRGDMGTSFAAPLTMRSGVGVRAKFQNALWAPTIKALLTHHAESNGVPRDEVGWGRLSHDLDDLVLCRDGEAHIIYQRQMPQTGAVRLYLPIPEGVRGDIIIKATFSFYSDVDPEDSLNYTRAGLEVVFRPDTLKKGKPYLGRTHK